MSKKDTIKILADLNRCYPFPQSTLDENVHSGLGKLNKEIIFKSLKCIEDGDVRGLGKQMIESQKIFDKYVAPSCPQELNSPLLHKTMEDETLKRLSVGSKGVGSQGDGTIQFLAETEEKQKEIVNYLQKKLKMNAYSLTINKTKPIKKAIIPVAGNGTRMYPISKLLKKAFLPIIDRDGILKPAIMCILEELDEAGIEEIVLIIDKDDQKDYDKFFKMKLGKDYVSKLSSQMLDYEKKIQQIGKKLKYIYQEEKLGLGHAVSLCSDFAQKDPVLLVLGDQLYESNINDSCTTQLLNNYNKFNKLTVSVTDIPLEDVSKYGILCGTINNNDNFFDVDKMYEKPQVSFAIENLYTINKKEKKYFSVFGEYILTFDVFEQLKKNIRDGIRENGEYQLTTALEEVRQKSGMIAFIPDGKMLDIGNVSSYKDTLKSKIEVK